MATFLATFTILTIIFLRLIRYILSSAIQFLLWKYQQSPDAFQMPFATLASSTATPSTVDPEDKNIRSQHSSSSSSGGSVGSRGGLGGGASASASLAGVEVEATSEAFGADGESGSFVRHRFVPVSTYGPSIEPEPCILCDISPSFLLTLHLLPLSAGGMPWLPPCIIWHAAEIPTAPRSLPPLPGHSAWCAAIAALYGC